MKPDNFLFYLVLVIEDIILNCLSLSVVFDVRKYSLAYRVIDIWKSLSNDIVNACSISVFKQTRIC